ncbi:ankycorbin-like isoform X2 [Liolophura sinensis]|uniref:ankycorbin-like isoform X2 n=1 Tax=Liolophura sinensis TaxID=3198878 RepID=UPI003158FC44
MAELIKASKNGYYNKVVELLQSGFSVRTRDRDNATALYWSACRGHAQICAVLVQAGSDINARVKWGSTALHACADRGHVECVKLLISLGAELDIQNVRGDTPLHLAGYRGYVNIVNILLEARASPSLLNEKKKTAEQEARGQGHIRVANILQNFTQGQQVFNSDQAVLDQMKIKTHPGQSLSLSQNHSPATDVRVAENKENFQFEWNDLDLDSGAPAAAGQPDSGWPHRRKGSLPQGILRTTIEPQESEEPCSASSWDGASPVDPSPLRFDEFSRLNNNNGKQTLSDILAEKKIKRPVSMSGYQSNISLCSVPLTRSKPTVAVSGFPSNQSAFSNSDIKEVYHSKWQWQAPVLSESSVERPGQVSNRSFVSSSANQTSGNQTSPVLLKRLEDMRQYAEDLQLKLVHSSEQINKLNKVNDEHRTIMESYSAQHELDKRTHESVMTENEALSAEVKSLRDQLAAFHASRVSEEVSTVRKQRRDMERYKNEPSALRSRQPRTSPPGVLIGPAENFDVSMDTSSVGPPVPKSLESGTPATTHADILHALKVCMGDKVLSDHHLHLLNQRFRNLLKAKWKATCEQRQLLDMTNREWSPGVDFTLVDRTPLNQKAEGYREGSCSLIFRISRHGKVYILKMMINLIDMASSGHGNGQSMPKFLTHHFGAEYDIPLHLSTHDNIVQICHFYEGSTRGFRHLLPFLVPPSLDVPLDMANRTTFMVMPEYPMTLKEFMLDLRMKNPEPPFGLSGKFLLLLLYQLLSAIDHLVCNGVVHRDIKAENIFLDNRLRPILGDFGFARRFHGQNGAKLMFTNGEQVYAGNSNAWAPELARLNRDGPQSLPALASLEDVYQKADAYAVSRMFYSLLRPLEDSDAFPFSSMSVPHYTEAEIPPLPSALPSGLVYVLKQLVLDHPGDRPPAHKAMVLVGMLLAGPAVSEVNTGGEFMAFYQAKMLQHMAGTSQLRQV